MPATPSPHHQYVNIMFPRVLWRRARAAAALTGYSNASAFTRAAVVEKLNRHREVTGMPLLDVRRHSAVQRKETKKRRRAASAAHSEE
jgi:hypothetical protein